MQITKQNKTTKIVKRQRRKRKLSASLEDYLEAIYWCAQQYGVARVRQIAERLGVGKSSVTAALKALAEKNYVNYNPYQFITLTKTGEALACGVVRKHQILKRFLTEILGVDEDQADNNACKMEHVMDDEVLDRMLCFIQYMNSSRYQGKCFSEMLNDFCEHGRPRHLCKECAGLELLKSHSKTE